MRSLADKQSRVASGTPAHTGIVWAGGAVFLVGLFVAAHTIYLAVEMRTPLLLADEWRVLPRYIDFMAGKLSLPTFLWEDHFGHRPAIARLLFMLDIQTVGGTQALPKTVSIILCTLLAALFSALLLRQAQIPLGMRLIGAGLLVLVFLPNQQIHNFVIGWNDAIAITVFFVVFALYGLLRSVETANPRAALYFLCALLCGIVATCSMANGLLVWPIMLLFATLFRAWSRAAIIALAGIAMTILYLSGFQRTGMLREALDQPGALIAYLVAFLGNPVMALGLEVSTVFGALGLALPAYYFLRQGLRTDPDSGITWFLFGVCLFAIGTAALTSLGRISFGAEFGNSPNISPTGPLALRYYSFISPLWAAILLLAFLRLKQNAQKPPGNTWAVLDAGALVIAIALCASGYMMGPDAGWFWHYRYERWEHAATAIVADAPDELVLKRIYPFPDVDMLASAPYLASHRLSVFRSDADFFLYQQARSERHRPLAGAMARDGQWCAGSIGKIDKVESNPNWVLLTGTLAERDTRGAADGILFVDQESRLLGIGRLLLMRSNADARAGARYIGYAEPGSSRSIVGYAFKLGRSDLCKLAEKEIAR